MNPGLFIGAIAIFIAVLLPNLEKKETKLPTLKNDLQQIYPIHPVVENDPATNLDYTLPDKPITNIYSDPDYGWKPWWTNAVGGTWTNGVGDIWKSTFTEYITELVPFEFDENGSYIVGLNVEGCVSVNIEALATSTNYARDYTKTPILRLYTSTATNELTLQDCLKLLWKKK